MQIYNNIRNYRLLEYAETSNDIFYACPLNSESLFSWIIKESCITQEFVSDWQKVNPEFYRDVGCNLYLQSEKLMRLRSFLHKTGGLVDCLRDNVSCHNAIHRKNVLLFAGFGFSRVVFSKLILGDERFQINFGNSKYRV